MKKTVHYRRAVWTGNPDRTLGEVIESGLSLVSPQTLPIFDIGSQLKCMIARRQILYGARYLHFVCYEEGAPVAVINTQVDSPVADADEQDPDGETEYIQAQLFCLISGNNIIWATHNDQLRENKIQNIFASFLLTHGAQPPDTQFGFQVVLDPNVVRRAFEEGIQEIDLGVGDFASTLERVSSGNTLPSEGLLHRLVSLLTTPATAEQLNAAANIEGTLVLRPGHDWKKPDVKELMVTMSSNIRDNYDDEFTIVTKSGLRLTRDRMSLKRDCDVQGNRRILDSLQMETQMRIVLASMIENGIIDE